MITMGEHVPLGVGGHIVGPSHIAATMHERKQMNGEMTIEGMRE